MPVRGSNVCFTTIQVTPLRAVDMVRSAAHLGWGSGVIEGAGCVLEFFWFCLLESTQPKLVVAVAMC